MAEWLHDYTVQTAVVLTALAAPPIFKWLVKRYRDRRPTDRKTKIFAALRIIIRLAADGAYVYLCVLWALEIRRGYHPEVFWGMIGGLSILRLYSSSRNLWMDRQTRELVAHCDHVVAETDAMKLMTEKIQATPPDGAIESFHIALRHLLDPSRSPKPFLQPFPWSFSLDLVLAGAVLWAVIFIALG